MTAADQLEVALDGVLARRGVGAEPGSVSGCAAGDASDVGVGIGGVGLGTSSSGVELRLPGR